MRHLLLLAVFIPLLIQGQTDNRYLAGAVPTENGKVVFSTEIHTPGLSPAAVYDRILSWAEANYPKDENRVVYQDRTKGEIALVGEEYLVFTSSALSLDRSLVNYRMIIKCEEAKCNIRINSIRYTYTVSYQREPEKYTAEEWIVDEYALHKNKLNRISGKFRKATIDMVDQKFQSASVFMGANIKPAEVAVPASPAPAPAKQPAPTAKEGYLSFNPDKIPQTILAILPQSELRLSTESSPQATEKDVAWKGVGTMFGKQIAMIAIRAESPLYASLNTGDKYTLSFFNADDPETAWMIIECNKQGETSEGTERTLIGEILNVWLK